MRSPDWVCRTNNLGNIKSGSENPPNDIRVIFTARSSNMFPCSSTIVSCSWSLPENTNSTYPGRVIGTQIRARDSTGETKKTLSLWITRTSMILLSCIFWNSRSSSNSAVSTLIFKDLLKQEMVVKIVLDSVPKIPTMFIEFFDPPSTNDRSASGVFVHP